MKTPEEIFNLLLQCMEDDNGGPMPATEAQRAAALPMIELCCSAGYFADDPADLDSSFWRLAAGERSECREFFCRVPDSVYEPLDKILGDVFNSPIDGKVQP